MLKSLRASGSKIGSPLRGSFEPKLSYTVIFLKLLNLSLKLTLLAGGKHRRDFCSTCHGA
jgi:hypothetical protein